MASNVTSQDRTRRSFWEDVLRDSGERDEKDGKDPDDGEDEAISTCVDDDPGTTQSSDYRSPSVAVYGEFGVPSVSSFGGGGGGGGDSKKNGNQHNRIPHNDHNYTTATTATTVPPPWSNSIPEPRQLQPQPQPQPQLPPTTPSLPTMDQRSTSSSRDSPRRLTNFGQDVNPPSHIPNTSETSATSPLPRKHPPVDAAVRSTTSTGPSSLDTRYTADNNHNNNHSYISTTADPSTGLDTPTNPCAMVPTIEPVAHGDAIEEDDEPCSEDGYESGSDTSTSAKSSVFANEYENGRRYQAFKDHRYPIPNDDQEQCREEMKHVMMKEILDDKLFLAPIGDSPRKILDIGTGTGAWAIDMGELYPAAFVRGIDISPIQSVWMPVNVHFLVDDCEQPWLEHDVDLVHFRAMAMVLRHPSIVFQHAYSALRPGGWIELQELNAVPYCDDGTMTPEDPVKVMYDLIRESFTRMGLDVTLPSKLGPLLAEAGFENIRCEPRKVPIGAWARDRKLRLIGLYQKRAILDIMSAFGGRPFDVLGMSQEERHVRLALARKGLEENGGVHRYFWYYFWYAQKPIGAGPE